MQARDSYYSCLEALAAVQAKDAEPIDPAKPPRSCAKARRHFKEECRESWVKHFDRAFRERLRLQRVLATDSTAPN